MGNYLSTRDTQKGTQTKHGRRCLRYVYVGANKILIGIYIGSVGCYLLHQVLHFDCSLCTIYYILFTLSYIHSNRHRNSEGLTLLRAAKTLSGMWSLNIRGDISTSSKSVFSAQMAWYTGSCLFRIRLETDTRGEG